MITFHGKSTGTIVSARVRSATRSILRRWTSANIRKRRLRRDDVPKVYTKVDPVARAFRKYDGELSREESPSAIFTRNGFVVRCSILAGARALISPSAIFRSSFGGAARIAPSRQRAERISQAEDVLFSRRYRFAEQPRIIQRRDDIIPNYFVILLACFRVCRARTFTIFLQVY